jgi:hypothetical protein
MEGGTTVPSLMFQFTDEIPLGDTPEPPAVVTKKVPKTPENGPKGQKQGLHKYIVY